MRSVQGVLLGFGIAALVAAAPRADGQTPSASGASWAPPLFAHRPAEATVREPHSVARGPARIIEEVLPASALRSSSALTIPLAPDRTYLAVRDRTESYGADRAAWTGHVPGFPYSMVSVVSYDGVLVGNILVQPGESYRLRVLPEGGQVLYRVDDGAYPPEQEPEPVSLPREVIERAALAPMTDDGSQIDVMVMYTPAAESEVGGSAAIHALAYLAVNETNQSYMNSGVDQRLNLVHIARTIYAESAAIDTDRERLRIPTDGYMDDVLPLRNLYAADVVVLLRKNDPAYCGIAYIMESVTSAYEDHGYAVVAQQCATGYYSFGHELGHIMSARHDCYADPTTGLPYAYNHGYVNTAGRWRTVMAYNDACTSVGVSCTRIPYWSNPSVTFAGGATGVPESGGLCRSENYRTLNNTALAVANFRSSSPITANVWMKDTWRDAGAEPDPRTAAEDMWLSPALWVRLAPDPDRVHRYEHQNPEFGQTNYVYADLHNGASATQSGTLRLYWANASTGLVWPADWTEFASLPLALAPNEETIAEAVWASVPGTGHYCMVARWDSATDPMTFTETSDINGNVRNNNNIVWRNLNVVDQFDLLQDQDFLIQNLQGGAADLDLAIEIPTDPGFLDQRQIHVALSPTLFAAWDGNGGQGTDIAVDPLLANTLRVLGPSARIEAIPMAGGAVGQASVTFQDSVGTGKYLVNIVQYEGGQRVGGVGYLVCLPDATPGRIGGWVSNQFGTALSGIEVSLFREVAGTFPLYAQRTTASNGGFLFPAPPGTYRLGFADAGGLYLASYFPAAQDLASAADIDVTDRPDLELHGVLELDPTGVEVGAAPAAFALHQNVPNPFNPSTTIRFEVPQPGMVSIRVYSVDGRMVRTLVNAPYAAGTFSKTWDGRDAYGTPVATGVYLYEARAAGQRLVRKMALLR